MMSLRKPAVTIKVELRRPAAEPVFHRFSGSFTFTELRSVLSHLWGGDLPKHSQLTVQYTDDEGDHVQVSSEAEWKECLHVFEQQQQTHRDRRAAVAPLLRLTAFSSATTAHPSRCQACNTLKHTTAAPTPVAASEEVSHPLRSPRALRTTSGRPAPSGGSPRAPTPHRAVASRQQQPTAAAAADHHQKHQQHPLMLHFQSIRGHPQPSHCADSSSSPLDELELAAAAAAAAAEMPLHLLEALDTITKRRTGPVPANPPPSTSTTAAAVRQRQPQLEVQSVVNEDGQRVEPKKATPPSPAAETVDPTLDLLSLVYGCNARAELEKGDITTPILRRALTKTFNPFTGQVRIAVDSHTLYSDAVLKGNALIEVGNLREAERVLATALKVFPGRHSRTAVLHYSLACLLSLQNRLNESFEQLLHALQCGYEVSAEELLADPDLEGVRHHPLFGELLSHRATDAGETEDSTEVGAAPAAAEEQEEEEQLQQDHEQDQASPVLVSTPPASPTTPMTSPLGTVNNEEEQKELSGGNGDAALPTTATADAEGEIAVATSALAASPATPPVAAFSTAAAAAVPADADEPLIEEKEGPASVLLGHKSKSAWAELPSSTWNKENSEAASTLLNKNNNRPNNKAEKEVNGGKTPMTTRPGEQAAVVKEKKGTNQPSDQKRKQDVHAQHLHRQRYHQDPLAVLLDLFPEMLPRQQRNPEGKKAAV